MLAALVAVALHRWAGLSPVVGAVLVAAWIVKDFVIYPWVRDAYTGDSPSPTEGLRDATGVVVKPLRPVGIVRLGSELWRAETAGDGREIPCGRQVRVEEVRGLTLRVAETATPTSAGPDPSAEEKPVSDG